MGMTEVTDRKTEGQREIGDRIRSIRVANDNSTQFPSVAGINPRPVADSCGPGGGDPLHTAWEVVATG
jgi:hypothetical protein